MSSGPGGGSDREACWGVARRGFASALRAVDGSRRRAHGRFHDARSGRLGQFERRWSTLRADESVITKPSSSRATIGSWGEPGEREVTYWIGRSYWGKGIATGPLDALLAVELSRP